MIPRRGRRRDRRGATPSVRRARRRGTRGRQPGRAARRRAARGGRAATRRARALRRDEPGHPRHARRCWSRATRSSWCWPSSTRVAGECARLADEHRGTLMAGRTLLQQAVPITFGLKAAGWLAGVAAARTRLRDAARRTAGAAGRRGGHARRARRPRARGARGVRARARAGRAGAAVARARAARWPSSGAALAVAAGAVEKIALDVVLLAQTEVGEVRRGGGDGRGGSSAMPHKRNPVGAVRRAGGARARCAAAAGVLLEAMASEHERAAGAWHSGVERAVGRARVHRRRGAGRCTRRSTASRSTPSGCARTSDARRQRPRRAIRRHIGATDAFIDRALELRVTVELHHGSTAPTARRSSCSRTRSARRSHVGRPGGARSRGRFRVLRYDQRGHGGSPVRTGRTRSPTSPPTRSRCSTGSGSSASSFCGLSLGGAVGDVAGARRARADRAARARAARRRDFGPPERGTSARATVRGRGHGGDRRRPVLERWFTPPAPPELVARLRRDAARHAGRGLRRAAARRSRDWTCAARSAPIRAPTLVIARRRRPGHAAGARSRRSPAEVPDARLSRARDAAHLANVEQAERVQRDALLRSSSMSDAHEPACASGARCSATSTSTARSSARPTSRPTSRTSSPATRGARSGRARGSTAARAARSR